MDCEREIEREGGRKEKGKLIESAGTLQHAATLLNAEEHSFEINICMHTFTQHHTLFLQDQRKSAYINQNVSKVSYLFFFSTFYRKFI